MSIVSLNLCKFHFFLFIYTTIYESPLNRGLPLFILINVLIEHEKVCLGEIISFISVAEQYILS
jgi:hypothetical protein